MFICSALRQTYLRQGGNDPAILAQMAEMEAEARTLDQKNLKPKRSKHKSKGIIFYNNIVSSNCYTDTHNFLETF